MSCVSNLSKNPKLLLALGFLLLALYKPLLGMAAAAQPQPQRNPYLADSPNNQSHWNDAATDSTPAAVPKGFYCVDDAGFAVVPSDGLGIPAYSAVIGGRSFYWFFSGAMLRKLTLVNGKFVEIDRKPINQNFPDRQLLSDEQRMQQIGDMHRLLGQRDEVALARYIDAQPNRLRDSIVDQMNQGVLYSLFTRDHGFIGANSRSIFKIDNKDPKNPFSPLGEPLYTDLPKDLFDDQRVKTHTSFPSDAAFGLGMSFNGFIVVSTMGGKIATFDRQTLKLIDTYTVRDGDELFTNSFAASEEANNGAVYIASNKRMYRFVVDNKGAIHTDAQSGAWAAEYDRGERMPLGKIADGTGATPTLMGFGPKDDKLVVITDGARKMRLVAFWRDQIPSGWTGKPEHLSTRIVDQITVDLGPDFPLVQSEQSVVIDGGYAFVLNAMVKPSEIKPYPNRSVYLRNLLLGTTRPLPRGIAMYQWNSNGKKWSEKWKRTDVGTIATVPMLSGGSRMVIVNGTIGDNTGDLYHLGFDLDSGQIAMSIASGDNPLFNGAFTGIKTDDDGSLMYTTIMGMVKFDVSQMRPALQAGNDKPGICNFKPLQ